MKEILMIFAIALTAFMLGATLTKASYKHEIGYGLNSIEAVKECEKSLPRDKSCFPIFSAEVMKWKNLRIYSR